MSGVSIDLVSGRIAGVYWRYTLPTVTAMVVSGLYHLVDGVFIGRIIGSEGLAAISMAWPWIGFLTGMGLMIGVGAGAHCSIAQGEGNLSRARQFLIQALWLLALVGVAAGLMVVGCRDSLMLLQGADESVHLKGSQYLLVIGWFSPLVLASIAMPILVRNLGAPFLATTMMLVGGGANIALDYLFIVELSWGLQGAAIATVIGQLISAVIGLIFLWSGYSTLPLKRSWKWVKLESLICRDILINGFSSLLMYSYIGFTVILHNTTLAYYGGVVDVAAYTIAGYLMVIYYMLAEGMAGGIQPLVSYFQGVGRQDAIKKVFSIALFSVLGSGMLFVILIFIFPHAATRVFIHTVDPLLEAAAVSAVRLHLFAVPLEGFLILVAAYFQAIGKGKKAITITLGNMCIQVPFLFILAPLMGVKGILLVLPVSTIILAIVVAFAFRRQFREQ